MKKFSYVSKKLLKDMGAGGGGDPTLPERVAAIETEIGDSTYTGDSITDAIADAQSDITTLKSYIATNVKTFKFDSSTATEQTLKEVLENSEVVEWFRKANDVPVVWTHFIISGIGNTALNGTYSRSFNTKKYSDTLSYKGFQISTTGTVMLNKLFTLKADTTTGAISYDETPIDVSGSYTKIFINFYKGEI